MAFKNQCEDAGFPFFLFFNVNSRPWLVSDSHAHFTCLGIRPSWFKSVVIIFLRGLKRKLNLINFVKKTTPCHHLFLSDGSDRVVTVEYIKVCFYTDSWAFEGERIFKPVEWCLVRWGLKWCILVTCEESSPISTKSQL